MDERNPVRYRYHRSWSPRLREHLDRFPTVEARVFSATTGRPVSPGNYTADPDPDPGRAEAEWAASVDAIIGVMIHSDLPSFREVVDGIYRVLRPGGVFVHIGVHPCFIGDFADRSDPARAIINSGYLDEGWTPAISPTAGEVGANGQVRDKVGAAHYTLAALLNTITSSNFRVVGSSEGVSSTPITFSLRALKPAGC